jgi:hypothetical protein
VLWAKFQAETLLFGGCDGLLQLPDDAQAAGSQCGAQAGPRRLGRTAGNYERFRSYVYAGVWAARRARRREDEKCKAG